VSVSVFIGFWAKDNQFLTTSTMVLGDVMVGWTESKQSTRVQEQS